MSWMNYPSRVVFLFYCMRKFIDYTLATIAVVSGLLWLVCSGFLTVYINRNGMIQDLGLFWTNAIFYYFIIGWLLTVVSLTMHTVRQR